MFPSQWGLSIEDLFSMLHDDPEDDSWIKDLAEEAREYLLHHRWCTEVTSVKFDRGFRHVAVFKCDIIPAFGADPSVWVVVGDIPPAYLDMYYCRNGAEGLAGYVDVMEGWLEAYWAGGPIEREFPVLVRRSLDPITPSDELASELENRLQFISTRLLPDWADEIGPIPTEPPP